MNKKQIYKLSCIKNNYIRAWIAPFVYDISNILSQPPCLPHLSALCSSPFPLLFVSYPAFAFPLHSPPYFPSSAPFPLFLLFPSLTLFLSKPFQLSWDFAKLASGCCGWLCCLCVCVCVCVCVSECCWYSLQLTLIRHNAGCCMFPCCVCETVGVTVKNNIWCCPAENSSLKHQQCCVCRKISTLLYISVCGC